jgi:hypothetical protein
MADAAISRDAATATTPMKRLPLRFVSTGMPRSGTLYVTTDFLARGVACGHETVFDHRPDFDGQRRRSRGLVGDSSWAAPLYFIRLRPGTRVLHVVRNPLHVLRSIGGGYFLAWEGECPCHDTIAPHRDSPYAKMLARSVPRLTAPMPRVERAARFIVTWTRLIETSAAEAGLPYRQVRVEDWETDIADTLDWLGVAGNRGPLTKPTPHDVHHFPNAPHYGTFEWSELLGEPWGRTLAKLALEEGYEVEGGDDAVEQSGVRTSRAQSAAHD